MVEKFIPPHGGYQSLLSYKKAEIVYDGTAISQGGSLKEVTELLIKWCKLRDQENKTLQRVAKPRVLPKKWKLN